MTKALSDLRPGQRGKVVALTGNGPLFRRILDMGLLPGTDLSVAGVAPMGDPMAVRVRGYQLSLRRGEAASITVELSE